MGVNTVASTSLVDSNRRCLVRFPSRDYALEIEGAEGELSCTFQNTTPTLIFISPSPQPLLPKRNSLSRVSRFSPFLNCVQLLPSGERGWGDGVINMLYPAPLAD